MLSTDPSTLSEIRGRAWRALQGGEYELALDLFRQLRLQDPGDEGVIVALARCLRRMGRGHEATALLDLQLQQSPESCMIQLSRIEGEAEAGRWQRVLRELVPLLVASPEDEGIRDHLHRAAARLLPADAWSADLPNDALLQRLQPWLPQRWLLICGLPDGGPTAVAQTLQNVGGRLASSPPKVDPGLALQPQERALPHLAAGLTAAFGAADADTIAVLPDADTLVPLSLWSGLADRRGLDATVVLVSLHPLLSLPLLQQQLGIDADAALVLWLQRQLEVERCSRGMPRLRLDADLLRRDPAAALAPLQGLFPSSNTTVNVPAWNPLVPRPGQERIDDARLLLALDLHEALLDPDEDRCRAATDLVAEAWQALTPQPTLQVTETCADPVGITYSMTYWGYLHHSLSLLAGGLDLPDHHRRTLVEQPRAFGREHDSALASGRHTFIIPFNAKDLVETWFLDLSPGQCRALAEGRLRLFLDGSNELGDDELVGGLIALLQRRGVKPDPSALHLVCQNRCLSGAGWFTVLPHDYYLVRSWQALRDQLPLQLRQTLAERDLLQTPAQLLCLNATPRPLRVGTLLALLDSGLWSPEQRPREHRISFGGFDYPKDPVRNLAGLTALLQSEGFPAAADGLERLAQLGPLRVDGFSSTGNELSDCIDADCWLDTRLALVTETECRANASRITEKTFKALALGHPTVVVGNPGSLVLARSLGFDTYDDAIDPSYDAIDRLGDRCRAAVATAAQLLDRLPREAALRNTLRRAADHNRAWAYDGFQMHYARSHSRAIVDRMLWREDTA